MQMTLRWYGSKYDTVTLKQIRQIPVSPESSPLSTAPLPEKSGKWMTSWP